jgi:hypothetical protein
MLLGLRGSLATLATKHLAGLPHWSVTVTESPWQEALAGEMDKASE